MCPTLNAADPTPVHFFLIRCRDVLQDAYVGDGGYLGAAPAASVGGRAASPDPKGVSRARSASPSAANAAVSAGALPHQSLEHAMQTKLTIGEETFFYMTRVLELYRSCIAVIFQSCLCSLVGV